MWKRILLIPTLDISLAERCLHSFYASLIKANTCALVIYNGTDTNISTCQINERTLLIGCEDSEKLAQCFSGIADYPNELLFGDPQYGRSYGGASNLLIAAACALDSHIIARVDDDCVDTRATDDSWLQTAINIAEMDTAVHFGHSSGIPSGLIYLLPRKTASQLGNFVYTQKQCTERLTGVGKGSSLKNGILAFSRKIATTGCYPVLYDRQTQTHVRGEIYCWQRELEQFKYHFFYHEVLSLGHYPRKKAPLYPWLRSIIVGYDFWFIYHFYYRELRYPTQSERKNAISDLKSWIRVAEWPEGISGDDLVTLLDEFIIMTFSNRIYNEVSARRTAWHRLMREDLRSVIRKVVPEITRMENH